MAKGEMFPDGVPLSPLTQLLAAHRAELEMLKELSLLMRIWNTVQIATAISHQAGDRLPYPSHFREAMQLAIEAEHHINAFVNARDQAVKAKKNPSEQVEAGLNAVAPLSDEVEDGP